MSEKQAQKYPETQCRVHGEHNKGRLGFCRAVKISKYSIQTIPPFGDAVAAFHNVAVTAVAPGLRFVGFNLICLWSAKSWSRKPNTVFLTEFSVFLVAVDGVSQNSLRPAAVPLPILPCAVNQCDTFVEIIKALVVDEGKTVNNGKVQLLSKLNRRSRLAPNYGAYMRLPQVDNSVRYGFSRILRMLPLLCGHLADGIKPFLLPFSQCVFGSFDKQFFNISKALS